MNFKLVRVAGLMVALAFLSACASFTPNAPDRLMLGLTPTNELGYEISTSGEITITSRELVLSTKAGMPETNVTGYRIEYFDQFDVLIGATSLEPQSLNVTVPAGIVCPEPDPVLGCSTMSPGAKPGVGTLVGVPGLGDQLLNADIAIAHAAAGSPTGWYAVLTLYYDNARGQFAEDYSLYIVSPN